MRRKHCVSYFFQVWVVPVQIFMLGLAILLNFGQRFWPNLNFLLEQLRGSLLEGIQFIQERNKEIYEKYYTTEFRT